jgi:signal peptidase I
MDSTVFIIPCALIVAAVVTTALVKVSMRRVIARLRRQTYEGSMPAGFWIRTAAYFIDLTTIVLIKVILLAATSLIEATRVVNGYIWVYALAVCVCIHVAYFAVPYKFGRQTCGKAIAGIALEKTNGDPTGLGRAFWRSVALFWLFALVLPLVLLIDMVILAVHPAKRSLHDFAAGTRVSHMRMPSRALFYAPVLCAVAITLFVFALLRPLVVQTFQIPATSMIPTLVPGDRFVTNKMQYFISPLQRYDVIMFIPPPPAQRLVPYRGELWCKRVIGLPGETIAIRKGKGIYINGKRLDDPYGTPECDWPPPLKTGETPQGYTIPNDACFVLGDNRSQSYDSYMWTDAASGQVSPDLPLKNIRGRATFLFAPFERARML